jgi:anaerobic magnesium-protoporphyrin IX monomethyl ester cyclase
MIDRICLITPPSAFLLDERVFMTLGILKVAAVLERAGVQVDMLDLSGIENYEEVVRDYVVSRGNDCYGVTATTPQLPAAARVQKVIRSQRPNARIILGGPHVTLVHAALRNELKRGVAGRAADAYRYLEEMFDVLVVGDGEIAIFKALDDSPPKLVDGDDPSSELFLTNRTLTELPLPARHLIDVDSYHYSIDGVRALSMIAQLGCPFGCGFCGGRQSPFLRKIRMRTAESIVGEMVHLYRAYGVQGFMLYDDELNVNPKMVELMQLIAKTQENLGVEFRLRGFIKSELFTPEQADAMYRAGFRWILVGFESGHDRILDNIQKKASRADNSRAMAIAKEHNLKVKALMSVGHPGESRETVQETRNWLLEVEPDDFDTTVITTYPGTPYFDRAVETKPGVWTYTVPKSGDRLHSFEVDYREVAEYYKGVPGDYRAYVYTDFLSPSDLVELRDWLEADVRGKLGIPYNTAGPASKYEHSMGQSSIPPSILRSSAFAAKIAIATGGPNSVLELSKSSV